MKLKAACNITKLIDFARSPWEVTAIQRVSGQDWQLVLLYTPTGYRTTIRPGGSPEALLQQAYQRLQQDTGVRVQGNAR